MNDDTPPEPKRQPPMPKAGPTPDYEERHEVHISKMPTGSIRLEDVIHELKFQAKRRLRRWISAGLIGAGGLGGGGAGMWSCDGAQKRAERAEARAKKAEETEARLRTLEEKAERCCALPSWVPPPP